MRLIMKSVLLLLLVALLFPAHAAGLDVRGEMSFFAELYPKNSTVTMLVVKGKMRTHLTGLMGEPVLNHQISVSIRMRRFSFACPTGASATSSN